MYERLMQKIKDGYAKTKMRPVKYCYFLARGDDVCGCPFAAFFLNSNTFDAMADHNHVIYNAELRLPYVLIGNTKIPLEWAKGFMYAIDEIKIPFIRMMENKSKPFAEMRQLEAGYRVGTVIGRNLEREGIYLAGTPLP
jgi:hypothetical protein